MTQNQRTIKRLIIIVIYLLIIGGLVLGIYNLIKPKATCNDGLKNQGEVGIDCGGPCTKCEPMPKIENIQVLEQYVIPAGSNKYDALVKIKNPNVLFGLGNFDYSLDFADRDGQIITTQSGSNFLLPGQEKYIFAFDIDLGQAESRSFKFRVKSFRWEGFSSYAQPNIAVYQKEFNFMTPGSGFAQLKAKIQNRSEYDFHKITTRAIIRDKAGRPVAINETSSNDVKVNEEREVTFQWDGPFTKDIDVQNIEVVPELNIFDNENFMKVHGSPEQYKTYGGDNPSQPFPFLK